MPSNAYKPIPGSDDSPAPVPVTADASTTADEARTIDQLDDEDSYRPLRAAVRREFDRPPPATWKRILLVAAIIFMGWLAVRLGGIGKDPRPQVIYASRYSDEFKYRPAASPVITEYLKDGRIRLRGASPGGIGVRSEDLPKNEKQIAEEKRRKTEEAREEAHRKLGLKTAKQRRQKRLEDSRKPKYPRGHPLRAEQERQERAKERRRKSEM